MPMYQTVMIYGVNTLYTKSVVMQSYIKWCQNYVLIACKFQSNPPLTTIHKLWTYFGYYNRQSSKMSQQK